MDRLHDEQFRALPEEDRYQGDESVEELLKRSAQGWTKESVWTDFRVKYRSDGTAMSMV